jgi:Tfp pilus assembly protein PilN
MIWKQTEAAIRVGADGAEWLVWQSKTEVLATGRMTAPFSVKAALDQWLARAARLRMKPKRIWLIAGAAECAHRRVTLPGTDFKVVAQAIPFAVEEDLPLPLAQMYWTHRTIADEEAQSTQVDVVATPINLYTEWEEAIRERKLDLAGRVPEGPHIWQEVAAIRAGEIDLLAVWGEQRTTLIRGTKQGMSSVMAMVREPGESWEAVLAHLRRPFQDRDENKTVLSTFTSDRLRKRILALPDLIPALSENSLIHEIFLNVPEQITSPVSLLALRRLRLEGREPAILFGDMEVGRPRVEFKRVATGLEVPRQVVAVAALLILALALWLSIGRVGRRHSAEVRDSLDLLQAEISRLDQEREALSDMAKLRADWGSVWLELSEKVPAKTLFKAFSFGQGGGIRIDGTTENQASLDEFVEVMRGMSCLSHVRITKTQSADNKLSFQFLASFDSSKVKRYEVKEGAKQPASESKPEKKTRIRAPKQPPTASAGEVRKATGEAKKRVVRNGRKKP